MFCAESEMDDEFVVTYSDIWFDKSVLEQLLNSKKDISLVVDRDWLPTYEERYQHPIEEAEKVVIKEIKVGYYIDTKNTRQDYIVPVYIFAGDAIYDSGNIGNFTGYCNVLY